MTRDDKDGPNSSWIIFLPGFIRTRISGRINLQAVLGNSAWQVTDKVIRFGVGIIVGLWVARYLGPLRFGQLNYAIALTALFGALADLGLDSIVIRELVRFPARRDVLLGSTFALKLIGATATLIVVILLVSLMRQGDKLALWLVALSAAGLIFQSPAVDLYFQAKVQSKYAILATNGAFLLMAFAKVALMLTGAPLIAFAWVGLSETVLASAFLLLAYGLKHQSMWKWKLDIHVMCDLLRDSWPLVLAGISVMIAMRVDQIMIGQMMNDKQVGLYAAAARISELWYFIPIAITSSTFPALIESKKRDEGIYYIRLQHLYNVLVTLAIALAVIMTFLSAPIVPLLYGRAYTASTGVLRVLIWSGIPVSFGCAWSNWMILEGRTKTMFLFQLNAAAVNLVLNLLLIPRFGIIGSAYATLISYSIGHVLLAALIRSQHKALAMLGRAVISFPVLLRARTGLVNHAS